MKKSVIQIVFLINILAAVVFSALWMKSIKQQLGIADEKPGQFDWIIADTKAFLRDTFSFDSVQSIFAHLSILLFVQFIAKSIFQFTTEYTSLKFQKITKCLSNLVESTLLYTMILGCIIFPMLLEHYQSAEAVKISGETVSQAIKGQKGKQLLEQILETFFYGRVLFAVGYLFGVMTSFESFRAYGLGLMIGSISIALSQAYNFEIWKYF